MNVADCRDVRSNGGMIYQTEHQWNCKFESQKGATLLQTCQR